MSSGDSGADDERTDRGSHNETEPIDHRTSKGSQDDAAGSTSTAEKAEYADRGVEDDRTQTQVGEFEERAEESVEDGSVGMETSGAAAGPSADTDMGPSVGPDAGGRPTLIVDGGRDEEDVVDVGDPLSTTSPTPGEFAENHLAERTRARHLRNDIDGHEALPLDAGDEMVGGWSNFEWEHVEDRASLNEGGRTEDFMEKLTFADEAPIVAETAYVTNYGNDPANHPSTDDRKIPTRENAHSQMALFAALDAMGVQVPRHVYDETEDAVIVESVSNDQHGATAADELTDTSVADKIDEDQLKDMLAAQLFLGNEDLKPDNIAVKENGAVVCFDLDYSNTTPPLPNFHSMGIGKIGATINELNQARSTPLSLKPDDVFDRAGELAREIDAEGMTDRIAKAAEQYDDYFDAESDPDLSPISDRVRDHVSYIGQF